MLRVARKAPAALFFAYADVYLKLQQLTDQAAQHETEKQQMREEFGLQRAKMKELYLQKEGTGWSFRFLWLFCSLSACFAASVYALFK